MLTHTREIIALYAFVNNDGVNELIVFRYIYIYIFISKNTRYNTIFFFIPLFL